MSGGIDVDLATLDTIAGDLEGAAEGLEGLAGSVPRGVDAGPMTAVVASMLSQVVTSAGNVSQGLTGTAEGVRLARGYYQRADADASAGMGRIRQVMEQ
ncbi:hypothetical protein HN031_03250 [Nocardioides sp. zg-1308]|uniref:ESX-1 secretion-associated protein n=1 Tax=Nocardioides renjunii TaxID=3095075 RepID=A0ABU5K6I7_9ACTN|nr:MULTISPECIES: hypothetical protein [unclassified Nocardioides]MDZ5660582.1 hypothetical protein [Nocardioides sp. S-58]NPD03698.1 hypothetical protein [Nocardioides sp. zg-1308]WQQ21579.1 hypothetical protein SHK17_17000 [Nocardioides sp. S-34]